MDGEHREDTLPLMEDVPNNPFSPKTPEEMQCIQDAIGIFTGNHQHGVDSKGRVIVPQVFRKKLGSSFVVGPSRDFKSIALYPTLVWAQMMQEFKILEDHFIPSVAKEMKMMTTYSSLNQECDNQGRILLPAVLRQRILGDERDVNITGNRNHVCITACSVEENEWDDFVKNLDYYQAEKQKFYDDQRRRD